MNSYSIGTARLYIDPSFFNCLLLYVFISEKERYAICKNALSWKKKTKDG